MRPPPARRPLSVRTLEDRLAPAAYGVTTTADAGVGSLRAALLTANAHPGADTITFAIPGAGVHTISPVTALPAITGTVTIDGSTQPGFAGNPLIELNGTSAGAGANGLVVNAAGSVVRDLAINRFAGDGIRIRGSNNRVEGCFIGTTAAGTAASPNGFNGVRVYAGADGVTLGGTAAGTRNVISGNTRAGVLVQGVGTTGTKVLGNIIGLTPAGSAAVANKLGVWVTGGAAGTVIGGAAGNTISGNTGAGVALTGAGTAGGSVTNNQIGTDPAGGTARPNGAEGIQIAGGARTVAIVGNVLSGNGGDGVSVGGTSATGVAIHGNRIGLNAAGTAALGNSSDGVRLWGGAHLNTIGGAAVADRNLIGGNRANGVELADAGTSRNSILGNYVGTNAAGTADVGNAEDGILVTGRASGNSIGGATTGAGNVVSGNDRDGVSVFLSDGNTVQGNFIGTNAAGTAAVGNTRSGVVVQSSAHVTLGGTTAGARNVISGNGQFGLTIEGSAGAVVEGNYVGTNAAGTAAVGNALYGVLVSTAGLSEGNAGVVVGGTVAGARNVISGNGAGISLTGNWNTVLGNYIGTNAAGTADLGNTGDGVVLSDAGYSVVGGTTAAARNVISGNGGAGVSVSFAFGNRIEGNYIGTNAAGTAALGNTGNGVVLSGGSVSNVVGGTAAGDRNVISGNRTGVVIAGTVDGPADENQVVGNFIGTDATGIGPLGNTRDGVELALISNLNEVGGPGTARNVISANGRNGVFLDQLFPDLAGFGNDVRGNSIGVGADGSTPLGNAGHGVFITNQAEFITIGGPAPGDGNVIAHNGGAGVLIGSDATQGESVDGGNHNSVLGNSIFANGGLGIDLGAVGTVTANDAGDADVGPNDLQNYPVLTTAFLEGSDLLIGGTINTTAGTTVRIEFFANPASGGSAEGRTYLGFVDISVGSGGTVGFSASFATSLANPGDVITATATAGESTSEFSLGLAVS